MLIASSLDFPTNHVLLSLKEELHTNPAILERKKNLYCLAAVVSSIVSIVFFLSAFAFQSMMLPAWAGIAGPLATVSAAHLFGGIVAKMIQHAKEMQTAANRLKEMQNTYQKYQDTFLSEPEKTVIPHYLTVIPHYLFAKKEYLAAEERLQVVLQHIHPGSPGYKLEEIIQLQHQVLLLKIDLSFNIAIFNAIATDNLNCMMQKKDLLILSHQDPLERNRIQGLNGILENKWKEPLLCFRNTFDFLYGSSDAFSDEEVRKMSLESLASHTFTRMNGSLTFPI